MSALSYPNLDSRYQMISDSDGSVDLLPAEASDEDWLIVENAQKHYKNGDLQNFAWIVWDMVENKAVVLVYIIIENRNILPHLDLTELSRGWCTQFDIFFIEDADISPQPIYLVVAPLNNRVLYPRAEEIVLDLEELLQETSDSAPSLNLLLSSSPSGESDGEQSIS